jgi:hypothetical protein
MVFKKRESPGSKSKYSSKTEKSDKRRASNSDRFSSGRPQKEEKTSRPERSEVKRFSSRLEHDNSVKNPKGKKEEMLHLMRKPKKDFLGSSLFGAVAL